jgi:spoIIIJ-associated protein
MSEASKQYFSGATLGQALVAASAALGVPPDRIRYQPVEGRHTSWKGTRRIVIAVDPTAAELPVPARLAPPPVRPQQRPAVEPAGGSEERARRVAETAEEMEVIAALGLAIRLSGLDLEAEARGDAGGVEVELFGRDTRRAVGRHGEVLRAFEHVASRICGERFPIRVDCGGFRARQDRALEDLAREACDEVLRERRAVRLEPMSPPERRIVHLVAKAAGLRSESLGEGFLKRVEISAESPAAE